MASRLRSSSCTGDPAQDRDTEWSPMMAAALTDAGLPTETLSLVGGTFYSIAASDRVEIADKVDTFAREVFGGGM